MTLINRIYAEVERTPWFTISQIAFALGTTEKSVTSTCSANGTTFRQIKTAEIQHLKNIVDTYRVCVEAEMEAAQ